MMIWENGKKHKKYRKEWAILRKHQIEQICWREMVWARPYKVEAVQEMLSHLAALSPRGAVIWEVRSRNGHISYLLGADRNYIKGVEEAIRAHGDIQFHEAGENKRTVVEAPDSTRQCTKSVSRKSQNCQRKGGTTFVPSSDQDWD